MKKHKFYTERPPTHHVIIDDVFFHVEHPLHCDLENCKLPDILANAWEVAPAQPGRYQVEVLGELPMLAAPIPNKRYKVIEVD